MPLPRAETRPQGWWTRPTNKRLDRQTKKKSRIRKRTDDGLHLERLHEWCRAGKIGYYGRGAREALLEFAMQASRGYVHATGGKTEGPPVPVRDYGLIPCVKCGCRWKTRNLYSAHKRNCCKQFGKINCPYCPMGFKCFLRRCEHMEEHHTIFQMNNRMTATRKMQIQISEPTAGYMNQPLLKTHQHTQERTPWLHLPRAEKS